ATGLSPGVLIADSFGRPWRLGQADVAIGCAGLVSLDDRRRLPDRHGEPLVATMIAVADQIAAAADLTRSKDDGRAACLIRGLDRFVMVADGPGARSLQRPRSDDLFR
ncbi:MAG: coenzyme F420-0:L-glutamate ligase, partial [Solirubrobacterales bacterium]